MNQWKGETNMDTYNLKLVKLINEAKLRGYNFINGKFIKSNKDNIIVLSLRGNSIGDEEDIGNYELFDKLYVITEEQKNQLKMCNNIEEVIDILDDMIEDEDYKYSNLWDDLFAIEEPFLFSTNEKELSSINKYPTYLFIGIHNKFRNAHGSIQVFQYTTQQFYKHKQVYIACLDINNKNH